MFASKDVFLKSSGGGYTIARSARFRSSVSAYLNRTFSTPTSQTIWTWSAWVKLGTLSVNRSLFGAFNGAGTAAAIVINSSDQLQLESGGNSVATSTALLRDPSSWYHIVCSVNGSSTTIYINNNSRLTYTGGTLTAFNTNAVVHNLGRRLSNSPDYYFDGYMTEINFVDGQALTPSSFGATSTTTGVWQPTKYTGTYGTNGFYLNFSSNSTAAALGTDSSGNGNTWTVNNLSVTTGATYDSMLDVPTLTSATVANYCVLNPLNKGTNQTVASGNLNNTASAHGTVLTTIGVTSGLWYAEATLTTSGAGGIGFTINPQAESSYGEIAGKWWCYDNGTNFVIINQTSTSNYSTRFSAGQVWQWALDATNGKLWIGVNNAWLNSTNGTTGNPATGANPTFTFTAGTLIWPILENGSGPVWNANFGQQPFIYTAPTGFVALNTYNLSTPTIPNGAAQMAATLYTGTLLSNAISNAVNSVSFQPDWVWIKSRSAATDNKLTDVLRGVTKGLVSNSTAAETTDTQGLTAFSSGGFTVGTNTDYNNLAATYVAWQWKANGTGVTNTSGSITSTVSANTTAGFSVVTYTGTGANATVGHGLGVAPSMVIAKNRTTADDWMVWHIAFPGTDYIFLDTTGAKGTLAGVWNSTVPSSTVFSLGTNLTVNRSGNANVAYVFAAVAGYSAFGSYTGNGSTDGPFVYLGFRPRWVMIKRTDSTSDWYMWDTSRDTYNVVTATLLANTAGAETSATSIDDLSNGFKCRSATVVNVSSGTYIYAAFAENPFKYSLAR
jgi:hypothetical protein